MAVWWAGAKAIGGVAVDARPQARQAGCGIPFLVLVAGLAAAAELFAKLVHAIAPAAGEYDASENFFGRGYLVQSIAQWVTDLPGLGVTYFAGSNQPCRWP